MSSDFGLRLTGLRRERGVSQKEASEALGVSQALLSHYEKGIRECGLGFIRRASSYYDVTSDYLLGLNENRRGLSDLFESEELAQDSEMKMQTIYRAIIKLGESLTAGGGQNSECIRWFLAFSAYRLLSECREVGVVPSSWFSIDSDASSTAAGAMSSFFAEMFRRNESTGGVQSAQLQDTMVFKTLIASCEQQMRGVLSDMI